MTAALYNGGSHNVKRMLAGADFPGYRYYVSGVVAGALWPLIAALLQLPQRPREQQHG